MTDTLKRDSFPHELFVVVDDDDIAVLFRRQRTRRHMHCIENGHLGTPLFFDVAMHRYVRSSSVKCPLSSQIFLFVLKLRTNVVIQIDKIM